MLGISKLAQNQGTIMPRITLPLTDRQRQIYDFVVSEIQKGLPPTRAEIGDEFGFNANVAPCHLQVLEDKGHIHIKRSISRSIRLIGGEQP